MYVDSELLDKIWITVRSNKCRLVLKALDNRTALKYTEIKDTIKEDYRRSGLTAYYVRLLKDAKLINFDSNHQTYFLSRLGKQIVKAIDVFENVAMRYDMSDLDAEGKVKVRLEVVDQVL